MNGNVIAIAGIDTGIGKSVATGLLARSLLESGSRVITQKMVQTGCQDVSEDILLHREIMGLSLQDVDRDGTTCPCVFSYPASPHLAAGMDNRTVDVLGISDATSRLQETFDTVLLEGAGGLLVPLHESLLFADYLKEKGYPLILVTSARLGSINHTLLSIEACRSRGLQLNGLLYNLYGKIDSTIARDTRQVFCRSLREYGYLCPVVDMPDQDAVGGAFNPADVEILLEGNAGGS